MKNYLLFFLLLLSLSARGNGGPIDASAIYKTGDIILMNRPDIELVQEDLEMQIEGDYTWVKVTYYLENKSDYAKAITYGFPIEFFGDVMDEGKLEWQDTYLPELEFLFEGKTLKIKQQVDLAVELVSTEVHKNEEMRRSWFVVDFDIPQNSITTLQVNYKIKNGFGDWAYSKSFYPKYSRRRLSYDFRPAQRWGNGKVKKFAVEIDARQLLPKDRTSLKLSGLSFTEQGGVYTYQVDNFDLKTAKDLSFSYSNEAEKLSYLIQNARLDQSYIKSISASSQLEGNYSASNLLDGDPKTAWVEGKTGNGVGEQIVIELEEYPLVAIGIINGYTKNAGTYTANGKIKKLRLELEYVGHNHTTKIESREIALADHNFVALSPNTLALLFDKVEDYGDGHFNFKKVTLTILEVYKGSKYSDTCISEIILLGHQ